MASTTRVSPQSITLAIATLLALALAAGFVYVQFFAPEDPGEIDSITFSQSKAVPDFDSSEYTVDDPAAFQQLLDEYDVDPENYGVFAPEGCTGGTETTAVISYEDEHDATLSLYDCGETDDFTQAATDYFEAQRTGQN